MPGTFLTWESLLLSSSAALYFQTAADSKDENNVPKLNNMDDSSPIYLAYLTWRGQFEDVIKSKWVRKHRLFQLHKVEDSTSANIIIPRLSLQIKDGNAVIIKRKFSQGVQDEEQLQDVDSLVLLCVAVSLYHLFLQENWTGPKSQYKTLAGDLLSIDTEITDDVINNSALLHLSRNGEPVYHLCSNPVLLFLANSILNLNQKSPDCSLDTESTGREIEIPSLRIWQFRILLTGLRILDEPTVMPEDILNSFQSIVNSDQLWWCISRGQEEDVNFLNEKFTTLVQSDLSKHMVDVQVKSLINAFKDISSQNSLVLGHYHALLTPLYQNSQKEANLCFVEAAKRSRLEYELTGRLGKKTKFQQEDKTQLVLLARRLPGTRDDNHDLSLPSRGSKEAEDEGQHSTMPQTLALNDDTLLEKTAFTSVTYDTKEEKDSKPLLSLDVSEQPPLEPLHQSILLSLSLHTSNSSPQNGLTSLQISSFVERVLMDAKNWSIHSMGLLLRSRLESSRTRTVQRGYFQLQSLVDQMDIGFTGKDADGIASEVGATACERLAYLHCMAAPSRWQLERELAARSISLGLTRSALDIYKKLEMWEDAVKCLKSLQKINEGRAIINQLLSGDKEFEEDRTARLRCKENDYLNEESVNIAPTMDPARQAKLWCIMGDLEKTAPLPEDSSDTSEIKIDVQKVLDDHKNNTPESKNDVEERARVYYLKAWEVSKHRSGLAIRLLGSSYYTSQQYDKAYECFKKSVAINSVHFATWFMMGCCAILLENWRDAESAYTRCVVLEDEDGEVWNNLASVHLRLATDDHELEKEEEEAKKERASDTEDDDQDKEKNKVDRRIMHKRTAFACLKQAIKRSYENWKIWTNYMVVSVDVGELGETCIAMRRLVELKWASIGEECIDVDILDRLVTAVIQIETSESEGGNKWGIDFRASVDRLFNEVILPHISTSPRIFLAHSRLLLSRGFVKLALEAHLKAYRAGVATEDTSKWDEEKFNRAVTTVLDVVDTLNNLGPKPAINGSNEDEVAASNHKFQAKSILRSFMGRTKDQFGDTEAWGKLKEELDELR